MLLLNLAIHFLDFNPKAVKPFALSLTNLSHHAGKSLWDSGSSLAVSGWGWVPAGAAGGQAADGLRCLAVLPQRRQRLLHVPHPGHRPQLWRLLCVPAAANAGVHGILCTGYVRAEINRACLSCFIYHVSWYTIDDDVSSSTSSYIKGQ